MLLAHILYVVYYVGWLDRDRGAGGRRRLPEVAHEAGQGQERAEADRGAHAAGHARRHPPRASEDQLRRGDVYETGLAANRWGSDVASATSCSRRRRRSSRR
jgi:hypothetical protein